LCALPLPEGLRHAGQPASGQSEGILILNQTPNPKKPEVKNMINLTTSKFKYSAGKKPLNKNLKASKSRK
jgi:hypothetical protein